MTSAVNNEKTPLIESVKENIKGSLVHAQSFGSMATDSVKGSLVHAQAFGMKASESVKGSLMHAQALGAKATESVKDSWGHAQEFGAKATVSVKETLSNVPGNVQEFKSKATESVKETIVHAHDFGIAASAHAEKAVKGVINGNASIRWLAFISATVLMVDTFIGVFYNIGTLELGAAILSFYAFTCGFAAVVMEADLSSIPNFPSQIIRDFLAEHVSTLHTVYGRGAFYFIAGTLELMLPQIRSKLIGFITVAISCFYIFLGTRVSSKITAVKDMMNDLDDADIKVKFQELDSSGEGLLDFDEFYSFLKAMDVQFDVREAEILYIDLGKDMNDRISYDEFRNFFVATV